MNRQYFPLIYLSALAGVLVILLAFPALDKKNPCKNANLTVPDYMFKKYGNLLDIPENTNVTIYTTSNSYTSRHTFFTFKYYYPDEIKAYSKHKNLELYLKKNKSKTFIIKVKNNNFSKTFYKFGLKIMPNKTLPQNYTVVKDNVLNNHYLLNKITNNHYKVVVELDSCKDNRKNASGQSDKSTNNIPQTIDLSYPAFEKKNCDNLCNFTLNTQQIENNEEASFFVIFDKSDSLNEFNKKPLNLLKFTIKNILNEFISKNIKVTIGAFDNSYKWLFENVSFNKKNVVTAKKFINSIKAYGGTNLYKILNALIKKNLHRNTQNYLLIVTDGFVNAADFKKLSSYISKKFKKIVIVGIGQEINIEFITHLATLFKASPYFINEKNQVNELKKIIKNMLANIKPASESIKSSVTKKEEDTLTHISLKNIKSTFPKTTFPNEKITDKKKFTKLYFLYKNNIYSFNLHSFICNTYYLKGFVPIAYNEFLQKLIFQSKNYNGKLIISLPSFSSLTTNRKFRKKITDFLFENFSTGLVLNSEEILPQKKSLDIKAGNYTVKLTFKKFKKTYPQNHSKQLNNCYLVEKKDYNYTFSYIWLIALLLSITGLRTVCV